MSRRPLQVYAVVISVALCALMVWVAHRVTQERREREAWVVQLRAAKAAREHDWQKLKGESAEIARLSQALAQARSVLAQTADGANPFEDAVGSWLDQVSRLNSYLSLHPEYGIPELRYLTANDWLDATKGVNLVTEADYRRALANLRRDAKQIVAPKIREALTQYLAANNGALPPDAQTLAAYLPAGTDATILQRYEINPSGQVKGLRGDQKFILLETKPVDPLWDSAFYFGERATAINGGFDPTGGPIADAISQFRHNTGASPTDVSQIEPYLKQKIDPARLADVFAALTTKPNLPPAGRGGK